MPLKIRPNAIEQEEGDFIFPGVISEIGQGQFRFDADLITGSAGIEHRNASSGFLQPIQILGSVLQFSANDEVPQLHLEQGTLRINPTAADISLKYLADDGSIPLYVRGTDGNVGINTDDPAQDLTLNGTMRVRWSSNPSFRTDWVVSSNDAFLNAYHDASGAYIPFKIGGSEIQLYPDGSFANALVINTNNVRIIDDDNQQGVIFSVNDGEEIVLNDFGRDIDFRIETTGSTHSLFIQGSDGFVGLNESAPARRLHISGVTGTFSRIEVAGSGLAAQFEYLRGSSFTWLGPTSGNEFHLWSQENIPLVLGLNNSEQMRVDPSGYIQRVDVTASPTGTAVPANSIRTWIIEPDTSSQVLLGMDDNEDRMVGFPHGYYALACTASTTISATPTYTKLPWGWLFGGILNRPQVQMLTHDSTSSDTDIIIRDSGIYEIIVDVTTVATSTVSATTCHGYIDKNGTKLTGTDFYTYNINATNGWDTGSTLWLGRLVAGDVISVKVTKSVGGNTVTNLAGGSRILIRQVNFST